MNQDQVTASFGANAASYLESRVHARGASLARLVELAAPEADWRTLDVATGAGHTAFSLAPHVRSVIATDITPEMLALAAEEADRRGLKNVEVAYAGAEALPFSPRAFDLVACRIAAHHFSDIPRFLRESHRVLAAEGLLVVVDNVVPGGEAGGFINAFEKLRDPSHRRCLPLEAWLRDFAAAGFRVTAAETLRKTIRFGFWAQRHERAVQDELLAVLDAAAGEAAEFLNPGFDGEERIFHLQEAILVGAKGER